MRRLRLAVLIWATGCGFFGATTETIPDAPPTMVRAMPAQWGAVRDVLTTHAVVESELSAQVVPQASGIVLEVRVEEGDAVKQGQVLAVIDNAGLQAGADRAKTEVAKLTRELATARALHAQGALSQKEVNDMAYQLQTAKTSLREAGSNQGQTQLLAPFDGIVSSRTLQIGGLASGQKTAFEVVNLNRLRVIATLPERDLARVAPGQTAELVSAYDPNLAVSATVDRVIPVVDPSTGTFRVVLTLPPGQQTLRPGQYVSVQLEVDRHANTLVIPKRALVYEDSLPVVYTVSTTDPAVANRRVIQRGLVDDPWVEVLEGLTPGDLVITVGQSNLKEGAPVVVQAPAEPPPPEQGLAPS